MTKPKATIKIKSKYSNSCRTKLITPFITLWSTNREYWSIPYPTWSNLWLTVFFRTPSNMIIFGCPVFLPGGVFPNYRTLSTDRHQPISSAAPGQPITWVVPPGARTSNVDIRATEFQSSCSGQTSAATCWALHSTGLPKPSRVHVQTKAADSWADSTDNHGTTFAYPTAAAKYQHPAHPRTKHGAPEPSTHRGQLEFSVPALLSLDIVSARRITSASISASI